MKIKLNENSKFKFETESKNWRGRNLVYHSFTLEDNPYIKLVNGDIKDKFYQAPFSYNVEDKGQTYKYNGDTYNIKLLNRSEGKYSGEFGWIVFKGDDPLYVVGIYEPHGCSSNKGVATFWGHEEIINLWLDDGEYDKMHTR